MIGIVVATHGNFSEALVNSAELIIGQQDNIITLGLEHDDSIHELGDKLIDSVKQVDQGEGVLVLVDLFGGSPSNVALSSIEELKFRSVSGVNMPMILEALSLRGSLNLQELTNKCVDAGQTGIIDLYAKLQEVKKNNDKEF